MKGERVLGQNRTISHEIIPETTYPQLPKIMLFIGHVPSNGDTEKREKDGMGTNMR